MNICYISDSILPSQRANSINIIKMCEAFASNGHSVTLIFPTHNKKEDINDIIDYYSIKNKILLIPIFVADRLSWLYFFGLKSYIFCRKKIDKFDLFFSRFPFSLLLLKSLNKPFIIEIHGRIWNTNIINKIAIRIINKSMNLKNIVLVHI